MEAVEIDHVPGRVFFRGRQWPEGFEFPSCPDCNRTTADDEQVLALLALATADEESVDLASFTRLLHDVERHQPEFIRAIRTDLGAAELKRHFREMGGEKPVGVPASQIPLVGIGPIVGDAVLRYGRKLMLALWYRHLGSILPASGRIKLRWLTNATSAELAKVITEVAAAMPSVGELRRETTALDDQFAYRYAVTDDRCAAAFLLTFRGSFLILGFVVQDGELLKGDGAPEIFSPFDWSSA